MEWILNNEKIHTDLSNSWMVSIQSTTILGFPPTATTRSVDSGQH